MMGVVSWSSATPPEWTLCLLLPCLAKGAFSTIGIAVETTDELDDLNCMNERTAGGTARSCRAAHAHDPPTFELGTAAVKQREH